MPLYDFYCECGEVKTDVLCKWEDQMFCDKCSKPMHHICNCVNFKLTYNNKTDMCDWSGNSSKYWDDVRSARERGEKVKGVNEN